MNIHPSMHADRLAELHHTRLVAEAATALRAASPEARGYRVARPATSSGRRRPIATITALLGVATERGVVVGTTRVPTSATAR